MPHDTTGTLSPFLLGSKATSVPCHNLKSILGTFKVMLVLDNLETPVKHKKVVCVHSVPTSFPWGSFLPPDPKGRLPLFLQISAQNPTMATTGLELRRSSVCLRKGGSFKTSC